MADDRCRWCGVVIAFDVPSYAWLDRAQGDLCPSAPQVAMKYRRVHSPG